MAQQVSLSDGSAVFVPDGTPQPEIDATKDAYENQIAAPYMQKAAAQNAPFTPNKIGTDQPGDMIYSGSARYPNTAFGQAAAWADHHGTGALSRVADPMSGGIAGAAGRAATTGASLAVSPILDPALQGLNLAKQGWLGTHDILGRPIPVEKQDREPIPTVGQVMGQDLGLPPASQTIPTGQRILEGVGGLMTGRGLTSALPAGRSSQALLSGGAAGAGAGAAGTAAGAPAAVAGWGQAARDLTTQTARDLALTTTGTLASDVAGRMLGPTGSYLAGLVASGSLPIRAGASAFFGPRSAHENAPAIMGAGQGYGAAPTPEIPNPPNVTPGATPGTYDFSPSFRALANPRAQRFSNWLESMPWAGGPLARSNEATAQFVQNQRGTAAEQLAGGPMPPGGATPESIGSQLIQGAREAVPVQQARRSALYDPINAAMTGQDVNFAPVQSAVNVMTALNRMPVSQTDAIRALVSDITSTAPGGANYDPARGPVPPLPQPTMDVPWTAGKEWLSGINRALGTGPLTSADAKTRVADIKRATVQAMQNAAEAQSPGLGQQYRAAQQGYADIGRNVLNPLYRLSGQPGAPGQFGNVGEGSAYNWLRGNLQSPSNIEPIATNLPPDYWNQARGQLISTLGNTPGGGFRPDIFARDWGRIGPQVQQQLTQGPGGMTDAYRRLQSAATIGRNFNVPPSASGLVSAIGTGAAAKTGLDVAGQVAASPLPRDTWYHGLVSRMVGPAAGALGVTRLMESPEMKGIMAGQARTPFIAQSVYQKMPRFAAMQEERQPMPGNWAVR
jgi:hypothetical protein